MPAASGRTTRAKTQARFLARYSPIKHPRKRTNTSVIRWKVRSGWRRANMSYDGELQRKPANAMDSRPKGSMAKLRDLKAGLVPRKFPFQNQARIARGAS